MIRQLFDCRVVGKITITAFTINVWIRHDYFYSAEEDRTNKMSGVRAICTQVNFNNPITITANDRLGLYSVSSSTGWNKISIPYDLDPISGSIRFTQTLFGNVTDFTIGTQSSLDSAQSPRTFSSFVQFCTASSMKFISQLVEFNEACEYVRFEKGVGLFTQYI
jgi:hypothetical protein